MKKKDLRNWITITETRMSLMEGVLEDANSLIPPHYAESLKELNRQGRLIHNRCLKGGK